MDYKKVYELIKVVVDKYYSMDDEDDDMNADEYMEEIGAYIDVTESGSEEIKEQEAEKMEGLQGFFDFLKKEAATKGIRMEDDLIDAYLAQKK